MSFFTIAPLWLVALALVGLTTFIAMVGPVIIRKRVSLENLRTNNEVAGFKFATVGVIYAVLLGFAAAARRGMTPARWHPLRCREAYAAPRLAGRATAVR
jgi:hypothetical protein